MMNLDVGRRGFLGMLGAMALDPERLFWRPDAKMISVPSGITFETGTTWQFLNIQFKLSDVDWSQLIPHEQALLEKIMKYPEGQHPRSGGKYLRFMGRTSWYAARTR